MAGPALGTCCFFTVAALADEVMATTIRATVIRVLVNMAMSPGLKFLTPSWCEETLGDSEPPVCEAVHIPACFLVWVISAAAAGGNGSARQPSRLRLLGPSPRRPIDTSPPVAGCSQTPPFRCRGRYGYARRFGCRIW